MRVGGATKKSLGEGERGKLRKILSEGGVGNQKSLTEGEGAIKKVLREGERTIKNNLTEWGQRAIKKAQVERERGSPG